MANTPTQKQSTLESIVGSYRGGLFVCRIWAMSLEVFLHRDLGERYLGWNAAAVWVLVPLYLLGWQGYDCRPMVLFLPVYLAVCLAARAGMARRRLRGEQCHSMYTGWPRFLGPKAKISELRMKQVWEPAVTMLLGWAVRDEFNAPLGTYLMIGGVCLFISVSTSTAVERMQALDLSDAVLEQEMVAERFREMRGERW
jgi:hypothetical protein